MRIVLGALIGVAARVHAAGHAHHPRSRPLGGEIPVREVSHGEKFIHVVALHDGDEVRAAAAVGVHFGGVPVSVAGSVVDVARLRDVPDVRAVFLRALGEGAAEALAFQPLTRVACPAHVSIRAVVSRRRCATNVCVSASLSPAAKPADWSAVFRVVSIGIQSGGKGAHFPTRGAATATPSVRGKRTSSRDASDANEAKGSTRRRRRAKRHTHGRTRAAPGTKKRSNPAGSRRETQRPWRLKCNAS